MKRASWLFGTVFAPRCHEVAVDRFATLQKRFVMNEVWKGDMIDSIKRCFELETVGNNIFRSKHLRPGSVHYPAVYGGLLFAQSLAAAEATVPVDMKVHALHSMFLFAATLDKPVDYHVTVVRDGRSFCSRLVHGRQNGDAVFICQLSFQKAEEGAVKHQIKMPVVKGPDECPELFEGIEKVLKDVEEGLLEMDSQRKSRLQRRLQERDAVDKPLFEMRPVNILEFLACKPTGLSTFLWLKSIEKLPDDPRLHRMMAAYCTDASLAGSASRPHQSRGFVPSQIFSLDHSAWLHNHNFRADEWMLYENISTYADGGRAFSEGRLWTQNGRLICTATQESLIRSMKYKSQL